MLKLATVLTAAAVLAPLAPAAAATTAIRACPTTISKPGSYKLAQDLTCPSGDGITIKADNVNLNLGGHTLTGTLGAGVLAAGTADDPLIGLEIQMGAVKNFGAAIALRYAPGALINKVAAAGSGTSITAVGFSVSNSPGVRISAVTARDYSSEGIYISQSSGAQIQKNSTSGSRYGIFASQCDGCALIDNQAIDSTFFGIRIEDSKGARIIGNKVSSNATGGSPFPRYDLYETTGNAPSCMNVWRNNRFTSDNEGDGPGKGCIR